MFSLLKSIFSLHKNPLVATYASNIKHRFHNHVIVATILIVYEILMLFVRTPQVGGLENGDIWFQVFSFLPFRSLLVSLGILIVYGINISKDYRGIRDEKEQQIFELLTMKSIVAAKDTGTVPIPIPPKPHWRMNWLHTVLMFCESIIYAALMFAFLPDITEGLLAIIAPSTPPPLLLPKQLLYYETTFIQGFAIACGSGFYEEFLFRYWLIRILSGKLSSHISPINTPFLLKTFEKTKWIHTPRFAASIVAAAIIYSLSHILIPTGDSFHLYFFFYRLLFAAIMSWVIIKRKFAVADMTHTLYDIFYFAAM